MNFLGEDDYQNSSNEIPHLENFKVMIEQSKGLELFLRNFNCMSN